MTEPRVSVLIPAYNVAAYLDEGVSSLMAQTLTDWEAVAVDDCSQDSTAERLEVWARRDSRVVVHRNERNLGMTGNWNRCLALARGRLVIKLDADDALRPRTLELLAAELDDDGVVGAGVRTLSCDQDLQPFDGLPADDAMMQAEVDPYADQRLPCQQWFEVAAKGSQLWHSCALMFRRADLARMGGWDERFGCASDTEVILRLLRRPGVFAHLSYVGVLYRLHPGSVSAVYRANRWLTWEVVVANLMALDAARRERPLSAALRRRYAYLWGLWRRFQRSPVEASPSLPPALAGRLAEASANLLPPPFPDRLEQTLRRTLGRARR